MNDSSLIAKRYAQALFNLCLKEQNLEAVEKAFDSFTNEVNKNKKFVDFMESPVIPHPSKAELLNKIIPQGMPPLLVLFLKLILSKKRFELLAAIETEFQNRSEKHRGVYKAEFVTTVPVTPETEKKLVAILERRFNSGSSTPAKIKLVSRTDKNLLGGFILKLDDRVVDASYRTKLTELRQKITASYI